MSEKHQSLYRKYRPQGFDQLVGQDHIKTILLNALKKGRIAHAYLFCGPRGTGKTSSARLIAKAVNCEQALPDGQPCNKCPRCLEARSGHSIDLIEIDAASNRGIEEIRDLREKIAFTPNLAKKKVFIIDEVHMLTKEAFNALLKTLEEPPDHAIFILATTEVHKIPATIISRCQRFDFRRVAPSIIKDRLSYIAREENIKAEDSALDLISKICEGCLRDAISLLDQQSSEDEISLESLEQKMGIAPSTLLETFYSKLKDEDTASCLGFIKEILSQGVNLIQFNKDFIDFLRGKLYQYAEKRDQKSINNCLKLLEHFKTSLIESKDSYIEELPLELAIVKSKSATTENIKVSRKEEVTITSKRKEPAPTPTPPKELTQSEPPQKRNAAEENMSQTSIQLAQIKENWIKVQEKVSNPVTKLSLSEVVLSSIASDGTLQGKVNSKFHHEKLSSAQAISSIEEAMKEVFGSDIYFSIDFDSEVRREVKKEKYIPKEENPVPDNLKPIAEEKIEDAVKDVFDIRA